MLSCKNCGAEMSGIDLICKKCGTPWGKKHKSRLGLYLSILVILLSGVIAYIIYTPGAKEQFMTFYNNTLAKISEKNTPITENTPPPENNDIIPVIPDENKSTDEKIETPKEPEVTPPEISLPPMFTWISASSSLKEYPPELTTDGKFETAWLEGKKGNGINEWIMYSSESDQTVSSITIYNGYLKNDKVYINNGRIKKLSIEFSDGDIITKDIPKSSFTKSKEGFKITLDTPKQTTSVKLTILDAYQGAYYTDTGISGISFE